METVNSVSATPSGDPSASSTSGAGPSKNFNLTIFIGTLIILSAQLFELGKKILLSKNQNDLRSYMFNSWGITMQTTAISAIGFFVLTVGSLAYKNYLGSSLLLFLTAIMFGKLFVNNKFKDKLTKFELPEVYEKYNYGANTLLALKTILLFFYCKKAFSETNKTQSSTFLAIFIFVLALLYCFINFKIISDILNFWLTEG